MTWKDKFPKENRYFETDLGILYQGDCLEIMKKFPDKSVDLVITDPPYGIGVSKGFSGTGGFNSRPIARRRYTDVWDNVRPNKDVFDLIFNIAKDILIFGGNYFADLLPRGTHWLFWDKLQTMPSFSDGELIYTNLPRKSTKKIVYEQNGLLRKEKETRVHPTQKPIGLISILLDKYSEIKTLILDSFLGSGTTAVACEKLGRRWIGIEISEKYCEMSKRRIKAEADQKKLFF